MNVSPKAKFSVAICGGGISGLCLAVALSKYQNIDVRLYESAEQFKEIGAGVMIWTRTWTILELMGLTSEFSEIAHAPPDGTIGVGFDYRRSDSPTPGFRFHIVEVPHGCIRFHRAKFLDVFVSHLPAGVAHFGKRVSSYDTTSSGKTSLRFQDGTVGLCDVLIGCDGIKSTIREQLYGALAEKEDPNFTSFMEPVFTGTIAYRGLIPSEKMPVSREGKQHDALQRPMMYCGKSKHVVSYSISKGEVVNVITFDSSASKEQKNYDGPWVTDCQKSELLACYADWEPDVTNLLQCVEKPTKWALHELRPLPKYVHGNIALVGDSAHAMLPHQGAGAGQAIEDAYVLACLLGSSLTTIETLPLALKAYECIRLPAANSVLRGSRQSGLMYEFDHPDFGNDYERLGPAIQKQWDWVWASHPDEEDARGISFLEARVHEMQLEITYPHHSTSERKL